jgi:hypothetical protein
MRHLPTQPHPNDPSLASTDPHHKHVPPNIKRNRIPAPQMSFTQPNLPALIQEIEELFKNEKRETENGEREQVRGIGGGEKRPSA